MHTNKNKKCYNNNLLHLYSIFLGTQSALHDRGISSSTTSVQHPPGWCDGSHSAPEHPPPPPPHTHQIQEWWSQSVYGVIKRPWWSGDNGEIWFLMTRESQDLGLTSHLKDGAFYSIVSPSLHRGVRTHTDHSNLVFPGGLPSRYWPAQPCLASLGLQGDMAAGNN